MSAKPTKTVIFTYQQLSNIGCEIIIRGSIAFMRNAFPQFRLKFVLCSYHADRDRQLLSDIADVEIVPMVWWKRYVRGVLVKSGLEKRFWTPRFAEKHFDKADLLMSVGGDIYSMASGDLPNDWLGWERYATRKGIPSIMFGANMDKIEGLPASKQAELIEHLNRFRVILVRDAANLEYLAGFGVKDNVDFYPDPIFTLRPETEIARDQIRKIGVNLTPIVRREYGDPAFERMAKIIDLLVAEGYTVKLIPHVYDTDNSPALDDRIALDHLYSFISPSSRDKVEPHSGPMSLAEISPKIADVDLFIGARMHSCLNAMTLGKPTYFLSYSTKARTMVDWLQAGPMRDTPERIACGASDAIDSETVLSFIKQNQPSQDLPKHRPSFVNQEMRDEMVNQMQGLGIL
ncbi:polysaccharide pyruvyl transferase family protein [Erythrobacter insulae]|nr:polysaccharide pyruvyl transferase family protein [Erythrobacter insulae]